MGVYVPPEKEMSDTRVGAETSTLCALLDGISNILGLNTACFLASAFSVLPVLGDKIVRNFAELMHFNQRLPAVVKTQLLYSDANSYPSVLRNMSVWL